MAEPILQVRQITKGFPGVQALKGVDLDVFPGEILALMGENGAGKSTLMKILAGVQPPDAGEIRVNGEPVAIRDCRHAGELGIALIHQELNLADNLDIGANIFLGCEPRRYGFIDRAAIREGAKQHLAKIGLNLDPGTLTAELSIGQQQMVEIAKALSKDARVLIMDEPTSSLSHGESIALFNVIRDLKAKGVAIVYISHRMAEVMELADRVTVLRDGKNAGDLTTGQISHEAVVKLMVGRDLSKFYARTAHTPGDVVLRVDGLRTPKWPRHEIDFDVRAGEIVGMAGLVGAGRTEVLRCIFGIDRPVAGTISVAGQELHVANPRGPIAAGVALVPEDRKQQGVIVEMSVRENTGMPGLGRFATFGWLNAARERTDTAAMIEKLRTKTPHQEQIVRFLSGGNQQKVVIGKWLTLGPKVLLLDEPTRGIDIGAKQEIYRLMEELAGSGVAILFVSSEMEEVIGMSDRTLVMHEGRLSGELSRAELSEEAVMNLATGRPHVRPGKLPESQPKSMVTA